MWNMSAVGGVGKGLGGLVGAWGSLLSGFADQDAAKMNAGMEENDAEFARQAGEDRANQILREGDRVHSTIRTRASASGLVADTGSPLLIQEESLYNSSLDALKERYAGKVAAYGHRQRADLYRMKGRQARAAGFMNASASLMSGAGGFAAAAKELQDDDKPKKDKTG